MEKNNTPKKCLLIAPRSFYFYSEYLSKTISSYNYEVIISNDEYPENTLGMIMGKLRVPLLLRITQKIFLTKFLNGKSYDLILIIKGRGLSPSLITHLKKASSKVIAYTYDSFKYHDAPLKWLTLVNKFYTFDYRDSDKHNLPIVELFSSIPEDLSQKIYDFDISAIVRNHSDRLEYIHKVISNLDVKTKFIYIYEKNLVTFVQNIIRSPILYLKYWKFISFKPLPYSEYIKVLRESNFTIDYAHPAQSGITIRCFEALSTQTKIITNNPFVTKSKYFSEENTVIFKIDSDPITMKKKFNNLKLFVPEKHNRTINHFIEELIS